MWPFCKSFCRFLVFSRRKYLYLRQNTARLPKIFEYFGFVFFFYSNEHEPIHVHVLKGEADAVFDIVLEDGKLSDVVFRKGKRQPMSDKDQKTAEAFVRKYYRNIVEKWVKFFVLRKAVRSTRITKKI